MAPLTAPMPRRSPSPPHTFAGSAPGISAVPATREHGSIEPLPWNAWQQVLARDPAADGAFVYAVLSTGIFCRPVCPSRRPKRENVRFFGCATEARTAGFRPCLRCRPEDADLVTASDSQAALVQQATAVLRQHAGQSVPLAELAEAAGVSRFALLRAFRKVLGVTPGEYARTLRRERFRRVVRAANTSVTDAIYSAGFGSSSRLYEDADQHLGMSPRNLRSGGPGELIRWSTAASPLGIVLAAETARGLCAVLFGDSEAAVETELRERFRRAELQRDDAGLRSALEYVLSHLREAPGALTLPLDVRATAFQRRVWEALRQIPRGETRSYAQIAAEVGRPSAVRAVGAAIGRNPLAVLVPCHRVIGSDGSLTGYHWGLERKQKLLALECKEQSAEQHRK